MSKESEGQAGAPLAFQPPRAELWLSSPWPLLSGLCLVAVLWLMAMGNPLETLEMRWMGQLLRWRYALGYAPASDPQIVHVDITRGDLERMPSLESEYQKAADLIRIAGELGARVIAFDVVFGRGTAAMNEPIVQAVKRAREQNLAVVFAEALIPKTGSREVERIRSFPNRERERPAGLINVKADSDGVFRQYEYASRAGDTCEPSMALATYLAWREVPWDSGVTFAKRSLRWDEIGADFKSMKAHVLPLGPVLLNMRAPWTGKGAATFRHFTVAQLEELQGAPPLANAVVFVSYSGTGLGDVGTTALAPNQPRVMLHSSALNDLVQNRSLHRVGRWGDLLFIVAVGLLGVAATRFRKTTPLLLFWAAMLIAIAALGELMIMQFGLVAGVIAACTLWSIAVGVEVARRYSNELVERLKLRATMGLYFSPRVMERVLKNPGSMEPQEAELTVLLTDLRNSTPIVETLGARGTFTFLNQVFEAQTEAVMSQDGSLEHFLGDQFLSYWGAPDQQSDAADRAFRAALALITAMEKLQSTLSPQLQQLFGYGVALHSGTALFGNKGSAKRLDFGLVGDLINAAARIESLTKHYGVMFLLTRETYSQLSVPPPTRVIDEVIVKGKTLPLQLLEVRHPYTRDDFDAIATEYNVAFESYRAGRFTEAGRLFAQLAARNDKPSILMAARCEELAKAPPAAWRGVYELQSK